MQFLIGIIAAILVCTGAQKISAAPQLLEELPVESPDGTYTANVEWDAAGFIGRIEMLIYTTGEKPVKSVELPQMKPAPANLTWISDNWVACESFIAEQGAAYFYMDVERERGYLLEILAPNKEGDWIISYTTNDSLSSDSIHTISRDHSSLFPVLLRELPTEGLSYLTPDFAYLLADAVDSFVQWRKKENFTEIKFLTPIAENDKVGRLAVMAFDNVAEVVYFPQRTTTTREMLALTQRKKLPDSLQKIISGIDPPELTVQWIGDTGEFSISGMYGDDESTKTELARGRFDGATDSPYTGPGVADLLNGAKKSDDDEDEGEDGGGSGDSDDDEDDDEKSSKSKKPSRSK